MLIVSVLDIRAPDLLIIPTTNFPFTEFEKIRQLSKMTPLVALNASPVWVLKKEAAVPKIVRPTICVVCLRSLV